MVRVISQLFHLSFVVLSGDSIGFSVFNLSLVAVKKQVSLMREHDLISNSKDCHSKLWLVTL